MSRGPRVIYRPRVEPAVWGVAGRPLPGVIITIPANGYGLFVSADNLRDLADQLHDAADTYEETTR